MPGTVVDAFELIDVDQHNGHLSARMACRTCRLRQRRHEMRAICQACQRIRHRQVGEMPLRILAVCDVDDTGKDAVFVVYLNRARREQHIVDHLIFSDDPAFLIVERISACDLVLQARLRGGALAKQVNARNVAV